MFRKASFAILILVLVLSACTPKAAPTPTQAPPPTQPAATNTPAPTAPPAGLVTSLEQVKTATIQIEAQGSFVDPEVGQQYNVAGRGSGFIIDPSGIAITNNHVVTGAALIKVWVGGDKNPRNAKVLGVSECWDLAVIDIEGDGYPYMQFYNGPVNTGLEIYAAGFPLGDPEYTLTKGIISKENANGESSWASVDGVVQHDATINPGNSGGPLVTKDGQVVAVNYAGSNSVNQYFSIRLDKAKSVIETLRGGNNFESIGINGQAVVFDPGDGSNMSGIWVSSVESGSSADKTGLKGGDIITKIENLVIATDGTMSDYCDILRSKKPGAVLSVEVLRYATSEILEGQINGNALTQSFSFASQVDSQSGQSNSGTSGDYSEFTAWQDSTGAIQVEVPTSWTDTDGSQWVSDNQTIGASITASTSLNDFNSGYSVPGVFFGVSTNLATLGGYVQLLDVASESYRSSCKYKGRFDYADSVYEGKYDLYVNCNGAGNTLVVLSARPIQNKTALLVLLLGNAMNDADLNALDHILATFDVIDLNKLP